MHFASSGLPLDAPGSFSISVLVTTFGGGTIPIFISATQVSLSLAIRPWIGATCTGNGFSHRLEKRRRLLRSRLPCNRGPPK